MHTHIVTKAQLHVQLQNKDAETTLAAKVSHIQCTSIKNLSKIFYKFLKIISTAYHNLSQQPFQKPYHKTSPKKFHYHVTNHAKTTESVISIQKYRKGKE